MTDQTKGAGLSLLIPFAMITKRGALIIGRG